MKNLGSIAAIGIGVGISASVLAAALGAHHWRDFNGGGFDFFDNACAAEPLADNARERRWTWDGGDTVDIAFTGIVRFRGGSGSNEVIARGSPEALANIKVQGSKISSLCNSRAVSRDVEIILPDRAFHRINAAGAGDLVMEQVNQPELNLTVAGSGSASIDGTSDEVSITIAGSGNAKLAKLSMKKLKVTIAGSGKIEAAPLEDLDVNIAGSGDVKLLTRPARIHKSIIGSGHITQPEES